MQTAHHNAENVFNIPGFKLVTLLPKKAWTGFRGSVTVHVPAVTEKHVTAISPYHVLHMWFWSHGIYTVLTLLSLHSVLTDVCCTSHGNAIGMELNSPHTRSGALSHHHQTVLPVSISTPFRHIGAGVRVIVHVMMIQCLTESLTIHSRLRVCTSTCCHNSFHLTWILPD